MVVSMVFDLDICIVIILGWNVGFLLLIFRIRMFIEIILYFVLIFERIIILKFKE